MRWLAPALALALLVAAAPAVGSFHETIGIVPDRVFALAMQGTSFNGLTAPHAPLLEAYVGERVRFVLAAADTPTFHLHGHPWLSDGVVVDTFLVHEQRPHVFDVFAGSVDKQPGDWMYHCHIDDHMQAGMWGIFRVYPFAARMDRVGHTLEVTLERLGEPLDGAALALTLDGAPVPIHVTPRGQGAYAVHADLPAEGALVLEARHPVHGTSLARAALGDAPLPAPTVTHAHAP